MALGALLNRHADPRYDSRHWQRLCNDKAIIELHLDDTPVRRERSYRVPATVLGIDGHRCRGTMTLYLRPDSTAATLRYGDRMLIHGYPDTLRHLLYTTHDHYLLTARDSTSLRARSEALRQRLLRRMRQGPLDPSCMGVAAAMALGWRGDLKHDMQSHYRDAGVVHLLCVSGLHVGLLAAMVGWLLFFTGRTQRGRIVRGALQIAAVWAFALLSGLAPATVRAALMFSLFIVSHALGRRTNGLNLLAFAAIAMLVAKPMLLFDVGWQLSYSAVAGLLIAQPWLRRLRLGVVQTAAASLAATLATMPVTVTVFHRLTPYFLVANILLVPLAGLLLALSLAYAALPCAVTALPLQLLIGGCNWLVAGIATLPCAVIPL
jgi:competence protein ComEC